MSRIRMLVSDVDGTLVTPDKRLTSATTAAVRNLRYQGILFTLTSSRPAFGLRALCKALDLDLPIGPFNGSSIVNPDMSVVTQSIVPRDSIERALELFASNGVDVWLFTNGAWVIGRDDGQYVPFERKTIETDPLVVEDSTPYRHAVCKLVGVSGDSALLARCEAELHGLVGDRARVARSQRYYCDVTPPGQDKGTFIDAMSERAGIPSNAIATIGDMANDLPMFARSGLSIAMGNASEMVKARADRVTSSNAQDGFAAAVSMLLDPRSS
jgi:Cof subfamily protein (haloacid dehalogenase superfamily)